eukprot:795149-Rhodomonas_salina.2
MMRRAARVVGVGLLAASASAAAFFQYGNFHVANARPLVPNSKGRRRKVIVAGGGIVGTCTAYILLERGFEVKVLEAGPPDGAGCVRWQCGDPGRQLCWAQPGKLDEPREDV